MTPFLLVALGCGGVDAPAPPPTPAPRPDDGLRLRPSLGVSLPALANHAGPVVLARAMRPPTPRAALSAAGWHALVPLELAPTLPCGAPDPSLVAYEAEPPLSEGPVWVVPDVEPDARWTASDAGARTVGPHHFDAPEGEVTHPDGLWALYRAPQEDGVAYALVTLKLRPLLTRVGVQPLPANALRTDVRLVPACPTERGL